MLKNSKLVKTNILVSIILLIGFMLTGILSYQANYQASLDTIEQVSSLSAEGIYYQITSMFATPINTSITMAHDSLLAAHISLEEEHLGDEQYIETTKEYLASYQKKYGFDSVFLVAAGTGRYYNFNGFDRVLTEEEPENLWYYNLLKSDQEYSLKVDNDEVNGADDDITVFVNCKIYDRDRKTVLGVVGVGIRIEYLKQLLKRYEEKFQLNASLVNENGDIEISATYTGYDRADWFVVHRQERIREKILNNKDSMSGTELWTSNKSHDENRFVVSRFIPETSWYLLVEQDMGDFVAEMRERMAQIFFILIVVILIIVLVITGVIRNFTSEITRLVEERHDLFKEATEHLYENIYELNITKNCYAGKQTEQYFEQLGAKGLPYDEGLRVIAKSQIKAEYRDGYVSTFTPSNVIAQYEAGNNHLQYDFMLTEDGTNYFWMRIDAYSFYSQEDDSIHMFTYRKNIDEEKSREHRAKMDEMTGFYIKKVAERKIQQKLLQNSGTVYALFLFDIDDFKQANDSYGHVFGDFCIKSFTKIIKSHFREEDLFGRMGGDEFAVFLQVPHTGWVESKASEVSNALNTVCTKDDFDWDMSASIGIAVARAGSVDFEQLFQKADEALYRAKRSGKKGFNIIYIDDEFK